MIPNELKEFAESIITKAAKIGNLSISVNFSEGDMSIHIYPCIPSSAENTLEANDLEKVEVYDDNTKQ